MIRWLLRLRRQYLRWAAQRDLRDAALLPAGSRERRFLEAQAAKRRAKLEGKA